MVHMFGSIVDPGCSRWRILLHLRSKDHEVSLQDCLWKYWNYFLSPSDAQTKTGSMTTHTGHSTGRPHVIILTQISWSFPTLTLAPRCSWEAHVVVGSVLGRGVWHAGLWLRLRLLPAVATTLLPSSTHGLGRCFLWWAERWKSSTQPSRCGGFAGKWRTTCIKKGRKKVRLFWITSNSCISRYCL